MGARLRGRSAFCGDVGWEACGLELGRAVVSIGFLGECSHLNLVVAVALNEVGIEACGLDFLPLRFGVGKVLECAGLDAVERLGLLLRFRLGGVCRSEALVDLGRDFPVPVVEVIARAALVRVVAVDGHVAAVEVVDALVLVRRPDEHFNAVPLTDVGNEVEHRGVGLCVDRVRVVVVAGNLNRDGAVVVGSVRGAPRAVFLLGVHADAAVNSDAVVAGCLSRGRREYVPEDLHVALPNYAMDGDGVDGVVPRARLIWRDFGVAYEWAVMKGWVTQWKNKSTTKKMGCGTNCAGTIISRV